MVFQVAYQSNRFDMGKKVFNEKNTFHAQFFNKLEFSYFFSKIGLFLENFLVTVALKCLSGNKGCEMFGFKFRKNKNKLKNL